MTTFSERVTAARKDKKLTQDQVAQALGVSRQLGFPLGKWAR